MGFRVAINLKIVIVEWKDETKMHLNVNHEFLNNNMQKNNKTFMWYIMIVDWKTCDLWLTCNWFNQNINV
jgi:hypothetical protein